MSKRFFHHRAQIEMRKYIIQGFDGAEMVGKEKQEKKNLCAAKGKKAKRT